MDSAQNLIATAYSVEDNFFIDLAPLDGNCVHPQTAGPTLFLPELPESGGREEGWRIKGFGKYIAVRHSIVLGGWGPGSRKWMAAWWMQIWDWQHSTASKSVLHGILSSETSSADDPSDFCFLENNRLFVVTENLELFSIEDMSQLLACFLLPISTTTIEIIYNPRPRTQAQGTTWISDPKDQLLSIVAWNPNVFFIVPTRIFFDLDFLEGRAVIPWQYWGPLNSRVFHHHWRCETATIGNRVFQGFPAIDMNMPADDVPDGTEYKLHMMDFSPLAVKRCQGVGQVVEEPSTIVLEGQFITTSLPYVGVTLERKFLYRE
ncbi:hypothetical protein AZE42_01691 [Rhizopogon vesiculosus]|uniref:Uncharacterized protein n=1 Tax=Rhizopogon vesiculosus TaxID=180088 RepID=A0A1J8QM93_9AGAM|nr:hypothetical protein AZE42_01691 [Rhizopogon vesiculosus]